MTEIRWKNGGPLFLQPTPGSPEGLFATEQNCCCPPPPPPRCWDCLDLCYHFIEITSPGGLAVRSPALECGISRSCSDISASHQLSYPLPDGFTETYSFSSSSACSEILTAGTGHTRFAYQDTNQVNDRFLSVYAAISVRVACVIGRHPTPFILSIGANVFVSMYRGTNFEQGTSQWIGTAEFDLPSACQPNKAGLCGAYTGTFTTLDTPVEFTADGTTTSLGAYQAFSDESSGTSAAEVQEIRDAVRDVLTATFRITSRPSCQTVECSCNSLTIYGTAWTFSQGGLTREYAWGDEQAEWGDSPYYIYWDGVGTFYLTRYDPDSYVTGIGGLMTEFHVVEFSCSTINGVPTWTATITSECFQYNNVPNQTHHSTDTWVGSIECYEACPDEWHGDGAPIPIGELVDVEYLGRTTEPGYSACDPPARVTVSGRQVIAPC